MRFHKAMRDTCGGILITSSVCWWKNYKTRSAFGEVIGKSSVQFFDSWGGCVQGGLYEVRNHPFAVAQLIYRATAVDLATS